VDSDREEELIAFIEHARRILKCDDSVNDGPAPGCEPEAKKQWFSGQNPLSGKPWSA